MMKILITESELKQALATAQSLGRKGAKISCLSANPAAASFYSRYCKEKFISPYLSDKENYMELLLDVVKKKEYDLLIPCSDAATEYVSEFRDKLRPYVRFVVPEHESLMTGLNKGRLMKFCREKGFPTPKTAFPQNREELFEAASTLKYPLVVKGTRGASAENVRYANSQEELLAAYDSLLGKAPEIIIQEHIVGGQFCFYALCSEGDPFALFMFRTLRSYPAVGGTPAKAISIYDADMEKVSRRVLKELRWSGMVNLDFMKDQRDGEYKLLEINPRIAGTVSLAISCGVDFPALLYDFTIDGKKNICQRYTTGKVFRSLFKEDTLHAFQRPRMIPQMLCEFLNPFVTYGIQLTDLAPLIGMAKTLKWEIEDNFLRKKKGFGQSA